MIFQNTIINDDSLKALSQIPDNSVDLTVTSPPYDNIRDYNGNWTLDFKKLGDELYRVTKDGGVCVIIMQDATKDFAKSLTTFRWAVDWVDNRKWKLFETCIYSRDGRPGNWWTQRFRVDHEYIMIFFKGERPKTFDKSTLKIPTKNPGLYMRVDSRKSDGTMIRDRSGLHCAETKCRGTIWKYSTSNTEGNKIKNKHPATFPDLMAEDLIKCFSKEGDIVLDPMCGSGTTAILAARNKRKYCGIEISKEFCDIIKKRFDAEIATDLSLM